MTITPKVFMKRFLCVVAALAAFTLAGCSTRATQAEIDQLYIGSPQVSAWHEGVLVKVDEFKGDRALVEAAGAALPTHGVLGGVGAVLNAASLVSSGPLHYYVLHLRKANDEVVALPPIEYTRKMTFDVGHTYRVFYAQETLGIKWPADLTKYPELAVKTAARDNKPGVQ